MLHIEELVFLFVAARTAVWRVERPHLLPGEELRRPACMKDEVDRALMERDRLVSWQKIDEREPVFFAEERQIAQVQQDWLRQRDQRKELLWIAQYPGQGHHPAIRVGCDLERERLG